MALIPGSFYTNIAAPSSAYPQGSAINASSPTALDGTPGDKDWVNDMWGLLQSILDRANVTPSGSPDSVLASDYMTSLRNIFSEFLMHTDTGTGTTVQLASVQGNVLDAYRDGLVVMWKQNTTNTAAVTLQIAALGTKDLTQSDGTALVGGELLADNYYIAIYNLAADDFQLFRFESYALIEDQKPTGTDGGTFTAGAWRTRDLNTIVTRNGINASLATNQITLGAGTYYFNASSQVVFVGGNRMRLYNVTDASTILEGPNSYAAGTATEQHIALSSGKFTITASKVIELQHYCQTTQATVGFGRDSNVGSNEIYARIEFWKI